MDEIGKVGTPVSTETFIHLTHSIREKLEDSQEANMALYYFQQREDAWIFAHQFITESTDQYAQAMAMTIFSDGVRYKWGTLDLEQRENFKNFYFELITHLCQTNSPQYLLQTADSVIIEILKYEWPDQWPNFLNNIFTLAKTSPSHCINSLRIIRLFSDDIFNTQSTGEITSERLNELQTHLESQFSFIYSFIEEIFEIMENIEVRKEALYTFSSFLSWIDLKLLTQELFYQKVISNFLSDPQYRIPILACFRSLSSHRNATADLPMVQIFNFFIHSLAQFLQSAEAFEEVSQDPDVFPILIQTLSNFMTLEFCGLMQGAPTSETIAALQWFAQFTHLINVYDFDKEFKICIETWEKLIPFFTLEPHRFPPPEPLIVPLQGILASKMVRPPGFAIEISEHGFEFSPPFENSEEVELFNSYSKTIFNLAKLGKLSMLELLISHIECPFEQANLPFIWCTACISGCCARSEEQNSEHEFIMRVFNALLSNENESNPLALISALYISSSYPNVLASESSLCYSIFQQFFSAIESGIPAIQYTALYSLDTLVKWNLHLDEPKTINPGQPSIIIAQEWLSHLQTMVSAIPPEFVPLLYSATTKMLTQFSTLHISQKTSAIQILFAYPLEILQTQLTELNPQTAMEPIFSNKLSVAFESLTKIVEISDNSFAQLIQQALQNVNEIFGFYSEQIRVRSEEIYATFGSSNVSLSCRLKLLFKVKDSIIRLFAAFFKRYGPNSKHPNQDGGLTLHLVETLVNDYNNSNPDQKFATILLNNRKEGGQNAKISCVNCWSYIFRPWCIFIL